MPWPKWMIAIRDYFDLNKTYYEALHQEENWIVSIELAKDDPDHFVSITYKTLDDKIGRARVARRPLLERMKELENKNIR